MDLPVSLFKEETTDVIRHLPQERVRERFVEQVPGLLVPQINEEIANLIGCRSLPATIRGADGGHYHRVH